MTFSATTLATIIPDLHSEDDAALARRVRTFLVNRHIPALRHLRVSADRGVITISGRVSTFYEKQLSHASARRVAGVQRVLDQVRVVPGLRTNPFARRGWAYNVSPDATGVTRTPR
jgi:osmotically-inducible protein OsmY